MADIRPIIANMVSTLELVPGLRKVYDHEPKTLAALPAATIYFDGFNQEDGTSRKTNAAWRWTVRLYIKVGELKKAQDDTLDLVVDVLNQFRANLTLGGTCQFHTITQGEIYYAEDQNNVHLIAELSLVATTHEFT